MTLRWVYSGKRTFLPKLGFESRPSVQALTGKNWANLTSLSHNRPQLTCNHPKDALPQTACKPSRNAKQCKTHPCQRKSTNDIIRLCASAPSLLATKRKTPLFQGQIKPAAIRGNYMSDVAWKSPNSNPYTNDLHLQTCLYSMATSMSFCLYLKHSEVHIFTKYDLYNMN